MKKFGEYVLQGMGFSLGCIITSLVVGMPLIFLGNRVQELRYNKMIENTRIEEARAERKRVEEFMKQEELKGEVRMSNTTLTEEGKYVLVVTSGKGMISLVNETGELIEEFGAVVTGDKIEFKAKVGDELRMTKGMVGTLSKK